jgi:hypothetical protein
MSNPEKERLLQSSNNRNWKKWGPYLSDRQWGTVREDYSTEGNTWDFVNHDLARVMRIAGAKKGLPAFVMLIRSYAWLLLFGTGKIPY